MASVKAMTNGAGPAAIVIALVAIATAATVGYLSAHDGQLAMVAAVLVLLVGVAVRDLTIVPVLAVPATLMMARVGGALSISDVVLAAASVVALFMLRGRGAVVLQPLIWAGVFYLATAIPTLILNPYQANLVEWAHEVVLVLGSLIVGFVIGREDRARLALSIYLVACSGIAVIAVGVALGSFVTTGVFEPVYLPDLDLHKNTIGGMLAVAAVIAFARPLWLGWSAKWAYSAVALTMLGVLAAQSRQGLIGAVAGFVIVSLRPRPQTGRRGKLIWIAAIPIAFYVISEVSNQFASDNRFNSAYQRVDWYAKSVEIWQGSPIFGVGMRWWYTDRFAEAFQPPNAELEVLTTTGVFGLIGFLTMFVVAAWHLMKMNPVYGTVGLAVLATRFTQAQFDLYWVAGQASLLWIIAGMCYGVQARDAANGGPPGLVVPDRAAKPGAPKPGLARPGAARPLAR